MTAKIGESSGIVQGRGTDRLIFYALLALLRRADRLSGRVPRLSLERHVDEQARASERRLAKATPQTRQASRYTGPPQDRQTRDFMIG